MAFLDNSGDIILDAVLTDAGRKRLAQGDGSFRIVKFALGDDEIDYSLFDKAHPSGSAYFDLDIMQTPVLEAFTNNTSLLKHKLMTVSQTNLLYLPEMRLNDIQTGSQAVALGFTGSDVTSSNFLESLAASGTGIFLVCANDITKRELGLTVLANKQLSETRHIRVDQGLNTSDISHRRTISPFLKEDQYTIRCDSRMLVLSNQNQGNPLPVESFIDDDMMATYYLSDTDNNYVMGPPDGRANEENLEEAERIIKGPMGGRLLFNLMPTEEIETSSSLFDELGGGAGSTLSVDTIADASVKKTFLYIDTTVRVTGITTGSSIDIPVRVLKFT